MKLPAQRVLVEGFISWDRVRERLARYAAIGRAFPLDLLERHRASPPYFCHYMAWRLGVWSNESLFERLEELLRKAEALQSWPSERGLLESAEYADFWSLVWQLQMAEYLCLVGSDVRWCGSGPDLAAHIGGKNLFVECYTYRKSFGLRTFLQDVLAELGNDIKLDHDWFMPFSLPMPRASEFLDRTLTPFLDEAQMERLRAEARERYPVKVIRPADTLIVYITGPDVQAYDPSILPHRTGDPMEYIAVILREAISAKSGSNRLGDHRPNLVAVSYLLSTEAAAAFDLRDARGPVELGPNIDALAMSGIGIDEQLSRDTLILVKEGMPLNPALSQLTRPP